MRSAYLVGLVTLVAAALWYVYNKFYTNVAPAVKVPVIAKTVTENNNKKKRKLMLVGSETESGAVGSCCASGVSVSGGVNETCGLGANGSGKPHWMDPQLMGSQTVQYHRNRALGDPIRGDLPIMPDEGSWFSNNANPLHRLHTGAMQVIGPCGQGVNELLTKYKCKASSDTVKTHTPYFGAVN